MYCSHCKVTGVPLMKYAKKKNGYYYRCRPCNTERMRRYAKTKVGSTNIRTAIYRSIEKLQYKQKARVKVCVALKAGKITKPNHCVVCKVKCVPHGHHEDYEKPFKVLWVCRGCHADIHKKMKEV